MQDSNEMLKQIKTALDDSACHAVTVKYKNIESGDIDCITLFSDGNNDDIIGVIEQFYSIESFKVSRRKFEPFGVGDLVSSKTGHGVIENVFSLNKKVYGYQVLINDSVEDFARHELVLLEKAKGDSNE